MKYRITIEVEYERDCFEPEEIIRRLERSVDRCVDRHELLCDRVAPLVVDEWSAVVDNCTD